MGLGAQGAAWKFLDSISEARSPSLFLGFCDAIKEAATRVGSNVSASGQLLSEANIRAQMVRARGRSLESKPAALPVIGHVIRIDDESWHVLLNMTGIPHMTTAVVDVPSRLRRGDSHRFRIVEGLLENGKAGLGTINDHQFRGNSWELYFYYKIQKIKALRNLFTMQPYREKPALLPPDQVFPTLEGTAAFMSTVNDDATSVRKFLDESDKHLVEHARKAELSRYLEKVSVTVEEFLGAQRPSFFGTRY